MKLSIHHWAFSLVLIAAVAGIGLLSSLVLPGETMVELAREGGGVEQATIAFYVLALVALLLRAPPTLDLPSRIAIGILLVASAARELDLHSALFGFSILKSNFYRHFATGPQMVVAVMIILPVVLSAAFLLKRHGRWMLDGARQRVPSAVTTLSLLVMLPVVKMLDRSLAIVTDWGVDVSSVTMRAVQLSLEEPLEMTLPLLIITALLQHRRAASLH